ncbi:probable ubiquitin-conjugating enzyme E2 23 [Gastrolobium bilobum]|uniref:probable ubiquitin-conjugating enzyme E2 23 n=1 Tax=Gastrolobium bilobum TaxID=150636 RepID=UPI002AB0CB9D|nr:probable ubiquitin-conjugating enzyme E2 23 [Gastrolobium bilobum]
MQLQEILILLCRLFRIFFFFLFFVVVFIFIPNLVLLFRKMGVQRRQELSEDNGPAENASSGNSFNPGDIASVSANSNPSLNTESSEVNEPGGISCKKSNIRHIYRQDVVKNNSSGMIGIVTEVAGDSDSDSDSSITDDEDDSEDEDGDVEEGDDSNNASRNSERNGAAGDCKTGALLADQLRVLWMDESESTQNFSDVEVVDRGFLHGDFVASASDPTGQVGVVVDVNMCVDLLSHDGSIIKEVSSKNLKRIRDFTVGDYVVLGPWLGRIEDVLDNVTVLFDDGSVCKVSKADPLNLKPISKNILEDGHFPYYPGQRVRASSSSVFKNSRWLSGLWKANRLEGTVTKVTVGSVFVYWIASAGYGPYSSTAPAEEQSPKNLKLLSCFAHANWQLGDWCLLPSSALSSSVSTEKSISKLELNDSINNELDSNQTGSGCDSEEATVEESNGNKNAMDLDPVDALEGNCGNDRSNPSRDSSSCGSSLSVSKDPVHEVWPLHRKKIRKVVIRKEKKARKKEESFEKALLIANTRTRVDVAWQDGKIECELDSTSLIPIENPGDHEFVSEQYVVEKTADDGEDICETRRVGVVKSVNAKERTACVRWLKTVARAEDPREFDNEEVVSVYELEGHPDYDYCYGDVVVRLSPASVCLETAFVGESIEKSKQKNEESGIKKEANNQTGNSKVENVSGGETCVEFSDLSWVGNITGLKNGDIEVTWADGMVSTVGPQAIYVVGRDDDDESIAAGSEISDAASWETVNDDEMEVLEDSREDTEREKSSSITSEAEESGENDFGRAAALSVPLAAFRFVTRLASGIFSRGQRNVDPVHLQSKGESECTSPLVSDESSSQKCIAIHGDNSDNKSGRNEEVVPEASEILEASETLCSLRNEDAGASCDNDACSLKHFDITKDPSDHYFIGANGQSNNRKWFKKVQQDWSILQNNLPEEIYVRVYEDRMDLLRAVIVGPYGTPYQDGLFFFDFHLPPEYPDVPPSAYYHSGGWRVNPNLYEEGKVCLSLLNTWTGRGNEVWDPKSSSILQVLVSLQGLVLNSKPYFNEAGYDKQIGTAEGEKNSLSYNENTFLLNCKTMMYLIRKPPKDFEMLIKEHFRSRGHNILKACDAYMKGYLIGSLTRDASVSEKSSQNSTSVGFKLMLAKIVPKLFLSLSVVGADCEEFKHLKEL